MLHVWPFCSRSIVARKLPRRLATHGHHSSPCCQCTRGCILASPKPTNLWRSNGERSVSWLAGVCPEMCFVQSFPESRADRVSCGITPGKETHRGALTNRAHRRHSFGKDYHRLLGVSLISFS